MNDSMADAKEGVSQIGQDILDSDRFHKAENTVHHYTTTVAAHSMRVATAALFFTRCLNRHGFHISEDDVVRSALLHDIAMTEEDVHDSNGFVKCFRHPLEGARIARDEYHVSKAEKNAILCHMWPATIIPPVHAAGWLVIAADKYASLYEVSRNVIPTSVARA